MDTMDIGYREVTFRMNDAENILSTPELLEKISRDHEEALQAFYDYGLSENLGGDTVFRLTLVPNASMASALREMVRVLELVKHGEYELFDDSADCEASRDASMQ